MVGKICTVCRNCSFINKNMSFFTYPGDAKRRYEWLKAVGRLDLVEKLGNVKTRSNYRICELHFEENYMKTTKTPKHLDTGRRKILTKNAFPTLNIQSVPEEQVPEKLKPKKRALRDDSVKREYTIQMITPNDIQEVKSQPIPNDLVSTFCESVIRTSVATQTNDKCFCSEKNIKNNYYFHSDTDQTKTNETSTDPKLHLKHLKNVFPKSLYTLLQWQLDSKCNGHNDYINYLALNLYYLESPYKLLKSFMNLPSKSNLKQYLIPKSTSICDNLKLFSIKVKHMSHEERICNVAVTCVKVSQNLYYNIKYDRVIGFVDVNDRQRTKPAENALVLVVQGIYHKWIQPVSYALFADYDENTVLNWIDEVLVQLFNIGLDVKVFVSNLQFKYACTKNITPEKSYFSINNRKIYYVYDIMQIIEYASAKASESNTQGPNDLNIEARLIKVFNEGSVSEANEIINQLIELKDKDLFAVYALVTLNSIMKLSKIYTISANFLSTNIFSLSNYISSITFLPLGLGHECTAREINKIFVNSFVNNMLKLPITKISKPFNMDSYINKNILNKDIKMISNHRSSLKVFTTDYRKSLSDKNSFPCVCEYLYKNCLERHYCSVLKIIHKTKEKTPPVAFKNFIKQLEKVFSDYFKENYEIESDIGHSLLREMSNCKFEMPCFCFPVDYLKSLFIRAKLYYMIRKNNKQIRQTNDRVFKICKIQNYRVYTK